MLKHTQQFDGDLPTNCLSVFDHFVGLGPKGLKTDFTEVSTGISEAAIGGVL